MGDGGHTKAGGKKLPEPFRYSPPQLSKYKEGHYDRPETELHDERKSHHEPNKNHHEPNKNHHEPNKNHHEPNKNHHEPAINYHEPNKNHHESIKKHPDDHKYHPDERHHDEFNNHHNGNNNHNDGHHNNHNKSVANGHVPPSHHNKRDDSPLLSAHPVVPAAVGHKPSEHHNRTPPDHPKAPHYNSIKGTPPQKHTPPKENYKNEKNRHPRAFDDYEIERRRQEMDRQGWPARDTKDYLIGGIYGPQPKSKLPNDAQPARQHHTNTNNNNNHHAGHRQESHPPAAVTRFPPAHNNNSYQPPSHAANRAQARKQKVAAKEPYRSRSFPRDDRNRLNNNNRKVPGQRNDPRSHSLMDLKGAPPHLPRSRNQSRAGNHLDQEHDSYLLDEDDEDYVLDPPERNGIKNAVKRGGKSRGFEGPVPTSELITTEATLNKAKVVQFFKNGDPFFPGVKVSIRPGRDFASFEALCNHLTPRTDLPIGVRYIFTMDGDKVRSLEDLEDGGTYVCSSRKKFVILPYGQGGLGWKPHSKFKMEEDLKLFRPPSPNGPAGNSSDGQTGSRGRKFIRVINNDDQSMQLRHMVNNRTTQPFENMIQGMAETLRMPHGKKLFSYSGKQIQSYSQLRNELREGDVFYLCTGESFGPTLLRKSETSRSFDEASMGHRQSKSFRRSNRPENETRDALPVVNRLQGGGNVGAVVGGGGGGNPGRSRTRNTTKSNNSTSSTSPTLTHVDPVRMKIKGQRREVYPPLNQRYLRDESPPDKNLELNWVYGYRGHDTQLNLSLLPTGELLYFVAAVAVLYDRSKNRQRHYTGHNEDIQCLAVHPTRELVATGQKEGKGRHSRAQIHIWDIDNLSTQMIIGLNDVENGVIALSFSTKNLGQHLLIVDDGADHMISIWNWKSKRLLSKSPIHRQKVVGGRFIPKDDTMAVTFGESHLTVWRRLKDGGFERDDLLDDDAKHVTCVEFDEEEEQYLITGDTDGNITLWSDSRTGVYQTVRVIQAHMRAVSAMMMLPDGTLLSSGGHEKDRYIKAWDSSHAFRAITFARLPESAGGVQSLCPSKFESPDLGIFAGTSKNMILEGSIHRRFKIVVQGHSRQLAALAIDPDEPAFVTAGFDRAISRWAMHKLVWKVQVQSECTGLAIHPLGEVVCVGTADGHIIVLTLHRGMHVATLPATKQVITCLGYSPDGAHLAVALEEGGMILYNVSGRGYAYRRLKILRGVDQILHMDWAIDCKSIQSVTSDYNLIFWDMVAMEQEKIPSTLRDTKWHTLTCSLNYAVNGVWNNVNQLVDSVNTTCCASTSDKLLSVGDDEGHIRLFRYPCITPRADFHEYKAQSSKINCVRFLYDDSFLISIGGDDAVLMQWMVIHAK